MADDLKSAYLAAKQAFDVLGGFIPDPELKTREQPVSGDYAVIASTSEADFASKLIGLWQQPAPTHEFFTIVDSMSCAPRGINSLLGRVLAMHIAGTEGLKHKLFASADNALGLTEAQPPDFWGYQKSVVTDERAYLTAVVREWAALGKSKASAWWLLNLEHDASYEQWTSSDSLVCPNLIELRFPPKLAPPTGLRFGSPVNKNAHACIAPGWSSALDFAQVYPDISYIPKSLRGKHHTGVDLNYSPEDYGLPVFAVADGIVIAADTATANNKNLYGWGAVLDIKHGDVISRYGHLKDMDVHRGDRVTRGQVVGDIGNANGALPSHLHCGICIDDTLLKNPEYWSAIQDLDELRKHFTDPVTYINERGFWL